MSLRYHLSRVCGIVLTVLALPVSAQMVQPLPGIGSTDPINSLSTHLRTLAASPRDLLALLGAGQSALDVGDPNAALGFFARADEIDPRNARAKAGLASALVMLEKPDDALRLFGEAVSLGVPESQIADDRGLAYDLRGDTRRAQRDYALAQRVAPNDEVTRRYALSLGISGDRIEALAMLDPLLRKQDQGAWRARAFILAMNNDVPGANAVARQVMPANLASTMAPFLDRLAILNPAERAHAVNFGTVPSDGQTFASVQIPDPGRSMVVAGGLKNAGDGLIPAGTPLGRLPSTAPPVARMIDRPRTIVLADAKSQSPAAKVSPGFTVAPAPRPTARISMRIAAVDPAKLPPAARGEPTEVTRVTSMTSLPMPDKLRTPAPAVATAEVKVANAPVVVAAKSGLSPPQPEPVTTNSPLPPAPLIESDAGLAASAQNLVGPRSDPSTAPPAVFEVAPASSASSTKLAAVAPAPGRLASILSGIEPESESTPVALPTATELRAAQRAAARKAAAASEAAVAAQSAKEEKAKTAALAKASPARVWVQIATGSNARGLGVTWRKIRDANEKLLKPYAGYTVPFKATNRVLAGPVKSTADARSLMNALGKAGVSATIFSSEAGQEIVKLSAK